MHVHGFTQFPQMNYIHSRDNRSLYIDHAIHGNKIPDFQPPDQVRAKI